MPGTCAQAESLFAAAAELSGEARNAFLDRACAGQEELRGELEGLLQAHDRVNHAIDRPVVQQDGLEATRLSDIQTAGVVIAGRYKLLERVGDGGMGEVWMAEQRGPVKRLVAVKLIKPGMDSQAVLARFEAERQALAMMDHPNIAKVHDAGTDGSGRPYFVMELVKGLPLTEYCDTRKLTVHQRLDLFVQICSAVQHAHQKAIIHRDLKPSNVLVTEHDGKPVPKVIDFGLAKALNASQMLTDRTLHTAYGTVVGTPLYMAPEQVGINALDVDTRTDIYALGVILYELLTGTTPLEKARFKEAAWEEVKRLIREEEPPRPSTRLSSDRTLSSLAASRQVDPGQLRRQVQGELDWIVMKTLEKERGRRYETATGLAKDVQRFLDGQTVEACPPTLSYRLRKAYRRHRASILIGGAFVGLLIVGLLVTAHFAIKNRQLAEVAQAHATTALENAQKEANARTEAEQAVREREQVLVVFRGVLEEFNPYKHPDNATIQEVLVRACESLDGKTDITDVMRAKVRLEFGSFFASLHEYQLAYQQFDKAYQAFERELGPKADATIAALLQSGIALTEGRRSFEDLKRAEKIITEACERNEEAKGKADLTSIGMRLSLSSCLFQQTRFDDLIEQERALLRRALENPAIGEHALITVAIRLKLAGILIRSTGLEDRAEAKVLCEKAIATLQREAKPGTGSNEDRQFQLMRAKSLQYRTLHPQRSDPAFARGYKQIVDEAVQMYPTEKHEDVVRYYDGLAIAGLEGGEREIARDAILKLMNLAPDVLGKKSPYIQRYNAMWGEYLVQTEQFDQAEKILKRVLASDEAKDGNSFASGWDSFFLVRANCQYAICLRQRREYGVALEHFEEALKILDQRIEQMGTFENRYMVEERFLILEQLQQLYADLGQSEKAAEAQKAIVGLQKTLSRIPR